MAAAWRKKKRGGTLGGRRRWRRLGYLWARTARVPEVPSILDVRARERDTRRESRHLSQGRGWDAGAGASGARAGRAAAAWECLLAPRVGVGRRLAVGPRRVGAGATRAGCVGGLRAPLGLWPCWAGRLMVGPHGQEKRLACEWAEGERVGGAGWAEAEDERAGALSCLAFLFSFPPFLIPYLFIPLLYLLPNAPKLVYMCCQHVQLLVGSSRGYLRVSGVHVEGRQFTGIDLQGRSIDFMSWVKGFE